MDLDPSSSRLRWNLRRWGEFSRFLLCLTGLWPVCRTTQAPADLPPSLVTVVIANSPIVLALLGATLRPHVLFNVPQVHFSGKPWRWIMPGIGAVAGRGLTDIGDAAWADVPRVLAGGLDVSFLLTGAHPRKSLERLFQEVGQIGGALRPVFIDGLPRAWPKGYLVPSLAPLTLYVGPTRPWHEMPPWSPEDFLRFLEGETQVIEASTPEAAREGLPPATLPEIRIGNLPAFPPEVPADWAADAQTSDPEPDSASGWHADPSRPGEGEPPPAGDDRAAPSSAAAEPGVPKNRNGFP